MKKLSLDANSTCILYALNKCKHGVLSAHDLNIEIKNYFEERLKWGDIIEKDVAGIPNITWHHSCIYKALKRKYGDGNFRWRKIPFHTMNQFLTENNKGRFYIHGKLNWKHFGSSSKGNWTHAICIDLNTGKFYDNTSSNLMRGYSIKKWFAGNEKTSHYMSEIHRVYHLDVNRRKSSRKSQDV